MKRETRLFVEDILQSITKIEEYTENLKKEEFFQDSLTQDAVLRRFEIMGEAVKNLPEDFRLNHPDVPWRQIAGLRDVLIHGYFGVNLGRVWLAIEKDLPNLKTRIINVLKQL
jgi:uncharacterized protein with HEPN domain